MPARAVAPSVPPSNAPSAGPAHVPRCVGGPGRDGGQTTVLVALVAAVALLTIVALTHLGTAVIDRARARTAADAAALAGVAEEPIGAGAGRRSATAVASENGATLVAYVVDEATVEVTVRVDEARATSRAERVVDGGG